MEKTHIVKLNDGPKACLIPLIALVGDRV